MYAWLLVWLVCGVIGAIVGDSRRDVGFLAGFLVGFLLGPLGLFILIVLAVRGERKICKHCAKRIRVEAKVCPYCSSGRITSPATPEPAPRPVSLQATKEALNDAMQAVLGAENYCANCWEPLEEGDRFCRRCGTKRE